MEICTVGSVRGESVGLAMVDLNGHEAGNGRYSQGRPTARRALLYSERCPVTLSETCRGRPHLDDGANDRSRCEVLAGSASNVICISGQQPS